VKTFRGVSVEFLRLTRNDARVDAELRGFLGRAYNLKSIADYETGPRSPLPIESAGQAILTARRFVESVAGLLPPSGE